VGLPPGSAELGAAAARRPTRFQDAGVIVPSTPLRIHQVGDRRSADVHSLPPLRLAALDEAAVRSPLTDPTSVAETKWRNIV
jgi:hypothetical protein